MHHLFFDLDGTLTDSQEGIVRCIQHALAALDGPSYEDREISSYIGAPLHDVFLSLLNEHQKLAESAVVHYRERYDSIGIFENVVYQGIGEMLSELVGNDYRCFVVTSKPRVYAQRIIEHFHLGQYFDAIYGSELDGTNTIKADLIRHVIASEKLSPTEVVMIGDRHHDILGAKANETASIGVLWGYGTHEELSDCEADLLVNRPADLPQAISSLTDNEKK